MTSPPGGGVAAGVGASRRRAGAPARAPVARPHLRRRGRGRHDDRGARRVEREGEARARLAAAPPQLARGLRGDRGTGGGGGMSEPHAELLEEVRPAAFAIAYRMLGSVAEAEDVVQEALLRLHSALESGERIESPREERAELARRFFAAAQQGDVASLEALLAEDVALHGDGGGKVPALARALFGRNRVARTVGAWFRQTKKVPEFELRHIEVNGQPGAMLMAGGRVGSVMALDIADGQVQGIRSVVNPDKLGHLGEVADVKPY